MSKQVELIAVTQPVGKLAEITADEFVAYAARVSNPSNQMNHSSASRLLNYLVRNRHWSPFEMVNAVMEVHTTRDIGRQVLRHASFRFQEFSQRYADVGDAGAAQIVNREARLQDKKNRQNSVETDDTTLQTWFNARQDDLAIRAKLVYNDAVEKGIALEQARVVLPEGLTPTTMYMNGSLRSWVHYCAVRMTNGTQKEHREIASQAWAELQGYFPSLAGVDMEALIAENQKTSNKGVIVEAQDGTKAFYVNGALRLNTDALNYASLAQMINVEHISDVSELSHFGFSHPDILDDVVSI